MSEKVVQHSFTATIQEILEKNFGDAGRDIFASSPIIKYLNYKTKSANKGSKSRGSFANHYALYVVVEDYLKNGFAPDGKQAGKYADYEGAKFSDLFKRQRELPFGQKLQNHALNARLNDEFKKYFPTSEGEPIVRDVAKQKYWVHEDIIQVEIRGKDGKTRQYNLAKSIIEIIDAYVATKKEAFEGFIETCKQISDLAKKDVSAATEFIRQQIQPNVDARIFEIVSFAILKSFYGDKAIFWGWSRDSLKEEFLTLYKTGRTNANDGGIDFVMKPLGRFFQVTETLDVNKYFLDIDKIQRFPLTFVVKSTDSEKEILANIEQQALARYKIKAVVKSYMDVVEEIINIPVLLSYLDQIKTTDKIRKMMDEVITQSKVEFNYAAQDDLEAEEEIELLEALSDED
jgi:hypothetical protein